MRELRCQNFPVTTNNLKKFRETVQKWLAIEWRVVGMVKITKYNKMWKIINFKEIIYQQGAFFDSVALALRVDSLSVDICELKSHEFNYRPGDKTYSKKIAVKLKLPHECQKIQLKLHAKIINMETQQQCVPLQLRDLGAHIHIDMDSELGSFSCKLQKEYEKYLKQVYKCEQSSSQSSQQSGGYVNEWAQKPTDNGNDNGGANGWKVNPNLKAKQNMDIQKTIKLTRQRDTDSIRRPVRKFESH